MGCWDAIYMKPLYLSEKHSEFKTYSLQACRIWKQILQLFKVTFKFMWISVHYFKFFSEFDKYLESSVEIFFPNRRKQRDINREILTSLPQQSWLKWYMKNNEDGDKLKCISLSASSVGRLVEREGKHCSCIFGEHSTIFE